MFKGQRKIGMGAKTKLKDWKASISFSNLFMCQDENKKIKITLHLPGFHIADQLKQRNSTVNRITDNWSRCTAQMSQLEGKILISKDSPPDPKTLIYEKQLSGQLQDIKIESQKHTENWNRCIKTIGQLEGNFFY